MYNMCPCTFSQSLLGLFFLIFFIFLCRKTQDKNRLSWGIFCYFWKSAWGKMETRLPIKFWYSDCPHPLVGLCLTKGSNLGKISKSYTTDLRTFSQEWWNGRWQKESSVPCFGLLQSCKIDVTNHSETIAACTLDGCAGGYSSCASGSDPGSKMYCCTTMHVFSTISTFNVECVRGQQQLIYILTEPKKHLILKESELTRWNLIIGEWFCA